MTRPSGSDSAVAHLPFFILAGGKSRRFGRDKATMPVGGAPLIVQLANAYAPLAQSVTVVAARADVYAHLGLRTIADVVHEKGPIGGLLTALQDRTESGWIFLSACDWVGVRLQWVETLLRERQDGMGAVVFKAKRFEPLFGLYHTSICHTVSSHIASGRLEMQELLTKIEIAVPRLPSDWATMKNVNRPSDL